MYFGIDGLMMLGRLVGDRNLHRQNYGQNNRGIKICKTAGCKIFPAIFLETPVKT